LSLLLLGPGLNGGLERLPKSGLPMAVQIGQYVALTVCKPIVLVLIVPPWTSDETGIIAYAETTTLINPESDPDASAVIAIIILDYDVS